MRELESFGGRKIETGILQFYGEFRIVVVVVVRVDRFHSLHDFECFGDRVVAVSALTCIIARNVSILIPAKTGNRRLYCSLSEYVGLKTIRKNCTRLGPIKRQIGLGLFKIVFKKFLADVGP